MNRKRPGASKNDRVVIVGSWALPGAELGRTVQRLGNRWFVVKNSHAPSGPVLLNPRYAMSWMRGPMTRVEIQRGREWRAALEGGGVKVDSRLSAELAAL